MDETTRKTFLLWSETEEYQKRVKESEKIIRSALEEYKRPYVAFSGGKDSTVMLHLVLQQFPSVHVFHYDYGKYMPRSIEREVLENAKELGVRDLEVDTGKNWYKTFFGRIEKGLKRRGYDLVFVGLRKEESCKRKGRIKGRESLGLINECWPLQNWTWKDVWAYVVKHELPYPSIYEKYAKLLGYDRVRFVTFFDKEFEKFGSDNLDGFLLWKERESI